MRADKRKEIFNKEIDRRLANPQWSSEIVSRVINRVRQERKKRVVDIASTLFPVASAAMLAIVLIYFIYSPFDERIAVATDNTTIEIPEVSGLVSDEVDQLVSYTSYENR
jgi:archaellum biogenesis protein FlaJ (TadC family)